jgi:hypothetical protein
VTGESKSQAALALPGLVYVLGAGRSGTTLLDVVLGNAPDAFSCGEIRKFLQLDGRPAGMPEGSGNWLFWDRVRSMVYDGFTSRDLARLVVIAERLESHKWFLARWLRLPVIGRADKDLYARYVRRLLEAIAAHSGRRLLIDSSKYPGRALALLPILGERMKVVWIHRSRKDVVNSFGKTGIEQPAKNWLSANLYWLAMRIMCGLTYRRVPASRRARLQFNHFVRRPADALAGLAEDLGLDISEVVARAREQEDFSVGWLFEGNRIRKQTSIAVRRRVSASGNS